VLVAEIDRIGEMALSNYLSAVELFEAWDETKALRVIEGHRQMDGEFQSELQRLMSSIKANTIDIGLAVSLALVAKALERITHHAQNLAEYAMFEREGVDLRLNQH
jgi:phosphate transport system protein